MGLVVDDACRTECALVRDMVYGLLAPCVTMAEAAVVSDQWRTAVGKTLTCAGRPHEAPGTARAGPMP